VPLWTPWGKGFKGVALRSALRPPSVQRPALGSYTTSWDANQKIAQLAFYVLRNPDRALPLQTVCPFHK
jgi:hypothetical protein